MMKLKVTLPKNIQITYTISSPTRKSKNKIARAVETASAITEVLSAVRNWEYSKLYELF